MYATATHRDRVALHASHYGWDGLADAPGDLKTKHRRSIRHATRQQTRDLAASGLAEYREMLAEAQVGAGE